MGLSDLAVPLYMGVHARAGKVDFRRKPRSIIAMIAAIPFPDISPDIFSVTLFGTTFALRWYAVAYIVGMILGWRLALRAVRTPRLWRNDTPVMQPAQVEDLFFWVILGVILGGRLGYVLFYQLGNYLTEPLRIFAIWEGGMSFHGGAIGVLVAFFLFTRRHKLDTLSTGDMVALGLAPGLFLGRVANFINAELWGRPTEVPWGVVFPTQAAQYCPEVAGICARHPSQLYEAALEGLLLGGLLIWMAWRQRALKREGLIGGAFLMGYGVARFFVEFFRQPDAQFVTEGNPLGLALHIGGYGLTMGQVLCVPMILVGLYFVLRAQRRA
jgi:phosphatidylglycerol:prolipoprotein diacylglycerol transferase